MLYPKAEKYSFDHIRDRIMGPNPIKLLEELLTDHAIPEGATVLDLGCGRGLTSVFLAREYGFRTFAADLWIDPTENWRYFTGLGLAREQIVPLRAEATALPFAEDFFDAVVSVDSYHYFGRDPAYLGAHLLPFVRRGGLLYIAIPGMKRDCHHALPPELLLSWTPEDLDTLHDIPYWRAILAETPEAEIVSIREMESNAECWDDWLRCDNEYAVSDRRSMAAGAGRHLNVIAMVLRRR